MKAPAATKRAKGYPFEAVLPEGLLVQGVVLADHLRSLDWRDRHAEFICKAPTELVDDVLARVQALLGDEA